MYLEARRVADRDVDIIGCLICILPLLCRLSATDPSKGRNTFVAIPLQVPVTGPTVAAVTVSKGSTLPSS